jgi:hypothetical protein
MLKRDIDAARNRAAMVIMMENHEILETAMRNRHRELPTVESAGETMRQRRS